ncbi:MAG: S8 family serine peptidase, partial [bacterium]|nr:S8 family serine peptidase [bacterium]
MRRALSVLLALALLVGAVSPVAAQTDGDDSSESQDVGEDLTEGLGPETLGPEASLEPDSGTQWTADAVVYPNLGSQLSAVAVAFDEDDPNSPLSGEAMRSSVGTEPNSVGAEPLLLTIQTDGNADGVVDFLASNGVSAANVVGDYLEAYVPPDLLAGLAAETGVERVREMPEPFKTKGSVKSAGVAVHGASVWHRNGFTGDGVKVGVIDTGTTATAKDGFTGLRALRGTELPSTVTGRCYIDVGRPSSDLANCDAPGGDNHGTLVAETLMDMVPDADLYVSNPRTWADLHSAVVWMHGQGVKVIVYAVSWNWHGPADGTSPVNPSPINTAKWAADNGIIWVNSAGNYGRMSWLGSFADTDNDGYHQWSSGGAEAQTFYLRAGAYMFIALRWDDTWGGATKDLDLQVRYSATRGGTQSVVGSSADTQNGRATDYPYEGARVKVLSGGDGYYSFYVKKKGSSVAPTWVQVLIFTDAVPHLPYYTAGGSIGSPADSSHAGVLAVGAASYSSTNVIRNYSSRGPTPDNRTKPDIVGVDCTRTVSKSSGFCGTSQSAPHVGGLAALVIDRNPSFTAQQVANYLKTNAEERGAPGADNTWGHGFAILPITGLIPDDGCAEALTGAGSVPGSWGSDCLSERRSGRNAKFYTFSLDSQASVRIDLESSVDTYLYLRRGLNQRSGGYLVLNDDGGTGRNSRIARTLAAGDYTIEATTFASGRTGSFTLTVAGIPAQTPATPEVSVTAGSGVTEGGDASFTVAASPVPSGPLSVDLTVAQVGDFGVSVGSRTVSVPTTGTATLTVSTSDDDVDETDGSVSVTVGAGSGYMVSATQGSASVVVSDDDGPLPVVSVTAGSGVTEGGDASFTVTAAPAPSASLSVDVTVAQVGDFGVSTGSQTVTVPTTGSATLTVATSDDDVDETDGSVSVTVSAGSGYTVSATQGSASVVVSDDDDPPVLGCGDTDALGLEARGNHDALPNTFANRKERNDWWRAWIALSGVTGTFNTPLTAAEARVLESGDSRWTRFRAALECLEGVPVVSVTGGSGVTEGGDAVFTVTATPAPSASLSVDVTVSQAGDFGVTTGARTVTVPTTGSATVTLATSDDSADEPNGSVSVAVSSGSGYSVSATQGSASVDVADNDDPPLVTPEVSISAGSGITEGGDASFTVSASPAPSSPLSVSVTVSQVGDFGASTGSRTVTVPTSGSATVTVGTTDDGVDETNGSVRVTINGGAGYTVSANSASASVSVADNDDPPVTSDGCVEALSGSGSVQGRWQSNCGSQARTLRYARFFTFSLSSEAAVRIDLESSLDTYLYLRRGLDQRSSGIVTADDDDGPGLNSRISRTLGAGVYTIE